MSDNFDESNSIDDEQTFVNEDEFKDFTEKLDKFTPIIPETVTEYYMKQSGLQTDDERVIKLLSASVQKFMSGIVNDCYQLHKLRERSTNRPAAANTAAAAAQSATTTEPVAAAATTTDQSAIKKPVVQTNQTLTLNDLNHVLEEYDINVKKTFYYT